MSSTWIALVTALLVAGGGGTGLAAYRTIKGTKATLYAGARKINVEADGVEIRNVKDVIEIYVDSLARCNEARIAAEARARLVDELERHVEALERQVAQLERRRQSQAVVEERRSLAPPDPPA